MKKIVAYEKPKIVVRKLKFKFLSRRGKSTVGEMELLLAARTYF